MLLHYNDDSYNASRLLRSRSDPRGTRMRALAALPDLTRKDGSPVKFVLDAVLAAPVLHGCDIVEIPETVSVETNFDLLNAPAGHPSRGEGDTFYIDATRVLRTHTTAFWPFYLRDPAVVRRLGQGEIVTAVCYGKVYRRDEIDRNHYPVFHQIDGLRLCRKESLIIGLDDLSAAASAVARSIYGPDVVCRETGDSFPFTDPSIQLEIGWNGGWLELMGAGLVHGNVLRMLGLDPELYNGWAFGFGLDRLAMVKMSIPDIRILRLEDPRITGQFTGLDSTYREVSRYPSTFRDVSLLLDRNIPLNLLYESIRGSGNRSEEGMVEEVKMIDRYDNVKFGDRTAYSFRIVYRSHTRTLTNDEVNALQEEVRRALADEFGAVLR